jgi:DNA-directed RNA polymerase specialized sigma24 family protein
MANCTRKTPSGQVGDMCASRLTIEEAMAHHEGLVHAFIRRQGGGTIPYREALQAGRIGLWCALKGYDAARGTAFSTYAWVAITRHIHRAAQELNRELGDWPGEVPASWKEPDPEVWVEQILTLEALGELVSRLPDRLQRVVVARYGPRAPAPAGRVSLAAPSGAFPLLAAAPRPKHGGGLPLGSGGERGATPQ